MSLFGPFMGLLALIIIGLGFLWVIHAERALGWQWWYVFMGAGLVLVLSSILLSLSFFSGLFGIAGACLVWGSTELRAQAARVELGWYPANPRRKPNPPFGRFFSKFHPPRL